jgi:hypothetical protein
MRYHLRSGRIRLDARLCIHRRFARADRISDRDIGRRSAPMSGMLLKGLWKARLRKLLEGPWKARLRKLLEGPWKARLRKLRKGWKL